MLKIEITKCDDCFIVLVDSNFPSSFHKSDMKDMFLVLNSYIRKLESKPICKPISIENEGIADKI